MSLIRQVWLLLLVSLLLALFGGAAVHLVSARDMLGTQLTLKNSDNAAALALTLSQQKGDRALMDLLMAAQFDTGFYSRIRMLGADGVEVFQRAAASRPSSAPDWFVEALPIAAPAGVAQVSDGWRALGAVEVLSHTSFAYDALWQSSLKVAMLTLIVGLIAAAGGAWVVQGIRRPLESAVAQAQALVDGRFVTLDEPRIPELQRLTSAMNKMVRRLKTVFDTHAVQVESLRQEAQCDTLTGISNRSHFIGQLAARLGGAEVVAEGGLVLIRVADLAGVNRDLGYAATDRVLTTIAEALISHQKGVDGCLLGRLNGSDLAMWLPQSGVTADAAAALTVSLRDGLAGFGLPLGVNVGAVEMGDNIGLQPLLKAADLALAQAESQGAFAVAVHVAGIPPDRSAVGERHWRDQISQAIAARRAHLVQYPVIDARQQLVHLECPLRLQLDPAGIFEPAARWLPLALRVQMTTQIDLQAVALALQAITADGQARCVNLAPASLVEAGFIIELRSLLERAPQAARLLSLELTESVAREQLRLLQELGRELRPLGTRLGIEHVGERLAHLQQLFELDLDYVKLDASVVHAVAADGARADFIKSLTTLLHGMSLQVYAEGVTDGDDLKTLWACGVDGATGPFVTALRGQGSPG